MSEPQMLTARQVARTFQVSAGTVYAMIRAKKLRAVRFGGSIRIPREAVEAFLCPGPIEAPISGDPEPAPARGLSVVSSRAEPLPDRRERQIVDWLRQP